jgi:hypothetical protein
MISGKTAKAATVMAKTTVEAARSLDIRIFQRKRVFSGSGSAHLQVQWTLVEDRSQSSIAVKFHGAPARLNAISLRYKRLADGTESNEWISVAATRCNYGGERWWFVCPALGGEKKCGRRCRFLYSPAGAKRFACRECHDLTYESTRKSGGEFYERIERPLKKYDAAISKIANSRGPRRRRLRESLSAAQNALESGFARIASARMVLEPILASKHPILWPDKAYKLLQSDLSESHPELPKKMIRLFLNSMGYSASAKKSKVF